METTFNILAEQFRPMVHCYLRTITGDVHLADDLAQETFISAQKSIDSFDTSADFGAWLRGIARNKYLEHGRSVARRKLLVDSRLIDGMEEVFSQFDTPRSDARTWSEQIDIIRKCVAELSDRLRESIELTYGQGKSMSAVSSALGATPAAVAQRLSRARNAIRECTRRRLGHVKKELS